ncbi:DUF2690 domain-containing protein [Streptomyces mirabilis]|uniref:helix-turn-helix domain-containing protein n=1 Tax=Streptomyces mirabilis TaxID=68239 RepID=UPI003325E985
MRDWVELPDALTPDARRLATELRRLKDHSGLSLTALAGQTSYSKSSWERYFNGKALPPRQAVLALGELVGAEPARLTALWEDATIAWKQRGAAERAAATAPVDSVDDEPRSTPAPVARPSRPASHRRGRVAIAAASLLACAGAGVFVALDQGSGPRDRNGRDIAASSPTRQLETSCFSDSCTAKDPKQTGCAGDAWTAALTKIHGVYVELRYSDACKAAWARISWGRPGDVAQVVADHGPTLQAKVHYDTDVYTAMTVAMTPSGVRACTTLTAGDHGCTQPGGTERLTEPPNPPTTPSPLRYGQPRTALSSTSTSFPECQPVSYLGLWWRVLVQE